ncbi:MAG: serine protease [Desulfamplus sp.]|nr:serine protease [Desulfamplus sp.]
MVEPGMAAFIKRCLDEILSADPHAPVVLSLDTFGGRVDSALDIVESVSSIPMGQSISFVETRAISAGALIALAGNTLIMKQNTLIGDCAPIIQTSEGQKELGEKTQTVLRAQFRALAKRNGYPEVLAESMVTKNMEVYKITIDGESTYMDKVRFNDLTEEEKSGITQRKTVVAEGELLTMDDVEAHELGFSQASVRDIHHALDHLGYKGYTVVTMTESWSEKMVRTLQPILPLLMLLGIGALYTELKAPGFGIPGILGIICLSIVFFNQYLAGLAHFTELILIVTGLILMAVEIFVLPGFGLAGLAGIVLMGAGLVLSFQGFVIPDPDLPWEGRLMIKNLAMVMGSFVGAILTAMLTLRFILPQFSRVAKGPFLETTLRDAVVGPGQRSVLAPGDTGTALTPLRPSGSIRIKEMKIDALTRGEFIDPGTIIVVDALEQNRVVVKEYIP